MIRIALIPTGRLELAALAEALLQVKEFRAADACFLPIPGRVPPMPGEEPLPYNGFTSGRRLTDELSEGERQNLDHLVQRMAAELRGDRRHPAADMAIVLDDLEVFNVTQSDWQMSVEQPKRVVRHIREAVTRCLKEHAAEFPQDAKKMAERLRTRGSFRLVRPMIEAWFFAAPSVLPHTGVSAGRLPPRLHQESDPEEFRIDDSAYASDDGSACVAHHSFPPRLRKRKENRIAWHKSVPRELHPKAYLSWLCREPAQPCCSDYAETKGGTLALQRLPWDEALADPSRCHYLGALLADIADFLNVSPPFVNPHAYHKAPTSRFHLPPNAIPSLRNL